MTSTLAANSSIPPYRRKAMDVDPSAGPNGHAAGVLYVAPDGDVVDASCRVICQGARANGGVARHRAAATTDGDALNRRRGCDDD